MAVDEEVKDLTFMLFDDRRKMGLRAIGLKNIPQEIFLAFDESKKDNV